jgi:hypothetical protein
MALPIYYSVLSGVTGSQIQIPSNVLSWSVLVQSGTAFINGNPVFAGNPKIEGGRQGQAGHMMGSCKIVVGCTGGLALVQWDAGLGFTP